MKAAYGYDLAPPEDWNQFYDISKFFTDKSAPGLYGSALILSPGLVHYLYEMRLRTAGGRLKLDLEQMTLADWSELLVRAYEEKTPVGEGGTPLWIFAPAVRLATFVTLIAPSFSANLRTCVP